MTVEFNFSSIRIKLGEFIIKGLVHGNREYRRTNVSLNVREMRVWGGGWDIKGARWDFIKQ